MKSIRLALLLPALAMLMPLVTLGQSTSSQPSPQSSFHQLKALTGGTWQGSVATFPPRDDVQGKQVLVWLRVTSSGNAVMHEMRIDGRPDDPITMFYVDGDRLVLTHYCDAGNRPRMAAATSPDGKTLEFDFLDVSGSTHYGHMHHVVFTMIDANHHMEDWTYMEPDGTPIRAHLDLQRAN